MLKVQLFNEVLDNPIIPASGTFGFGYEFSSYYDINILGSISLKGTTINEKFGNIQPRIADCKAGMLNSIGLQNPGAKNVLNNEIPKLKKVFNKKSILNVGGAVIDDYLEVIKIFNDEESILAFEVNISCPNVKSGGMAFGVNEDAAFELVKEVKKISKKPIIVKLSPNVSDIVSIAKKVRDAGADAISLINTLVGMRINLKTRKPILGVIKGGYSGPGVFPVALRMVYEVSRSVDIPVIGMGGITNAYEVLEMMMAGATAVMIGTQNLIDPYCCEKIIKDLPKVMEEFGIKNLSELKELK